MGAVIIYKCYTRCWTYNTPFLFRNFDTFASVLFQVQKEHLNIKLWKGTQCRAVSIPKILNLWKIFNFAYLKHNVLSLRTLLRLYFSAFLGRNGIRLKRKWAIKWVLFEQRFYHDITIILKSWSGQVRWLVGEVKINFTSHIVRGAENMGMPTLGYFALCLLNPIPNKPWFLRVWSTNLLKTLREKEKLLITSNLFFLDVFYSIR